VSERPPDMTELVLTLYVAGDTMRSREAIANLRRICDEMLGGRPSCDVVDVLADPEAAESQRILTTPTLVRERPAPPRRVTGDLSDPQRVLASLALSRADLPPHRDTDA